ncbi:hypothetical protein CARUB_v10018974mg [Capsella rubella]|uniref:Bifunctional inhibitor/plant lipid transfer protein/seed storage helical domain-containing protein n=1 Tax=Capsella rubella TaxID=81985 RepID=R0HNW4_9BRAS|nr:uncharacterized protein LOC17886796 [Capsella rubella]EOA25628.1 hypothetical protein CARUB_v10018974mg [Capsella rubella]
MKTLPLPVMSIAFLLLLTSFPDPTVAYCKEALHLCIGTIKGSDRATYVKCCERLITPGTQCVCKYVNDPALMKVAYRLMAACGKPMPINKDLKKHYKCGSL